MEPRFEHSSLCSNSHSNTEAAEAKSVQAEIPPTDDEVNVWNGQCQWIISLLKCTKNLKPYCLRSVGDKQYHFYITLDWHWWYFCSFLITDCPIFRITLCFALFHNRTHSEAWKQSKIRSTIVGTFSQDVIPGAGWSMAMSHSIVAPLIEIAGLHVWWGQEKGILSQPHSYLWMLLYTDVS